MHLAQLNVGRLRAPIDDPLIDDFRDNLAPVNTLAEVSPGYVWRLQDEAGDATGIKLLDDDLEIIDLTVWESIEALADLTYRTGHVEFLRRRREFFEAPTQPTMCLWWIPEGTLPTPQDAIARLAHLRAHGPTPTAFTFRQRFDLAASPPARAATGTPARRRRADPRSCVRSCRFPPQTNAGTGAAVPRSTIGLVQGRRYWLWCRSLHASYGRVMRLPEDERLGVFASGNEALPLSRCPTHRSWIWHQPPTRRRAR